MNRRSLLCMSALAFLTTLACGGAADMATQGTAEDEAAIRALSDQYVVAFNANDAAGIAALVADDYESVAPDGTMVMGKAGVEQMIGAEMQARQKMDISLTLSVSTNFLHWLGAESATLGGSWAVNGAPAGSPSRGSWLAVAQKAPDGQWLIVSDLAADYREAPPAEPPPAPTG